MPAAPTWQAPLQLRMSDEPSEHQDISLLYSEYEIKEFEQEFTTHPTFKELAQNPFLNQALLNEVINETNSRLSKHAAACCLVAVKPWKFALTSAASGLYACKTKDQRSCILSCLLAAKTCTQCCVSAKEMRVSTKAAHKTCVARNLLQNLQTTEEREKKNK